MVGRFTKCAEYCALVEMQGAHVQQTPPKSSCDRGLVQYREYNKKQLEKGNHRHVAELLYIPT